MTFPGPPTLDESVMTLLPEGSPDRGCIEIIRGLS